MAFDAELVKIELLWTLPNAAVGVNVLHATLTNAGDNTERETLAGIFADFWGGGAPFSANGFKQHFPNELRLDTVRVTTEVLDPPEQSTLAVNEANSSGDPGPNESCLVVTWTTPFIGRSRRGRTFFPCPQEAAINTSGVVDPASLVIMQSDVDDLISEVAAMGAANSLVVKSPTLLTETGISGATVRQVLHHQSSRNS